LWLRGLIVFVVSGLPLIGGYELGVSIDCHPGDVDGQCGMGIFTGVLIGGVGSALMFCGWIECYVDPVVSLGKRLRKSFSHTLEERR
jgi:hypothetical protein